MSLRADVEALAAIERRSASAGERASGDWVRSRLERAGAVGVETDRFRYQHTFAHAQGLHFAAGLAAAMLGGKRGTALGLAALASLDAEFSGRSQWLRRFLPAGEGTNVSARIPARAERRRTLVLVAHHDAAHTGLMWSPRLAAAGERRAAATDAVASYAGLPEAALGLVAAGSLTGRRASRVIGSAVLATALALVVDQARGETVPGASDNATGVAAMLALVERIAEQPLTGTEVIALAPGCEESGMGGMAAWLASHRAGLDPATTLVLGLDTLGAGRPTVVSGEGGLRTTRYREQDLMLVDSAADRAGLPRPRRFRIGGWTDPALALFAGLPAVSLASTAPGGFTNYHVPSDTPERVDWASVESCIALAGAVAEEWAAGVPGSPRRPRA